ncbi:MAG TPA: PLP-dependent aspartate aminotransferase family protein [candidate division Zixibacteria bacterium]|nr:PLP-dependent aspartate aminotransferase family protein [candidate division Zixibacteria bacterium]
MSADKNKRDLRFETSAVHCHAADPATGAVSAPIYQTATYKLPAPGDESGYVYTRSANPTRDLLQDALAKLEGGAVGLAFASGLAATNTVMNLFKTGDHVIAGDDLYGGTLRQFENVHGPNSGIQFTYVDGRDPQNVERAFTGQTKLVWIETPTNPLLKVYDIATIARIAHAHNALLVVDNTFATPYLQRPLELGADIVLHSLTKYLAGHSDTVGGAIITKERKLGERLMYFQNAVGAVLAPFDCWLAVRGIKTLPVRLERQCQSARAIAEWLQEQENVTDVNYPGLDGSPLPNGMKAGGGMVSFRLDGDFEAVKRFVMSTKLFTLAESLGGVESLVNHPASMTHASVPREVRLRHGVDDGLVRLSVGVEHVDDLIADLNSALAAYRATRAQSGVTAG